MNFLIFITFVKIHGSRYNYRRRLPYTIYIVMFLYIKVFVWTILKLLWPCSYTDDTKALRYDKE